MYLHAELLQPLLAGLPESDRAEILRAMERTRDDQIDRKRNPARRRRRNADGELVWPDEHESGAPNASEQ
jgi:hypothetical protein